MSWPFWAAPSIARAGGWHVAGGDVEAAPGAPAPVAACSWQPWFVVGAPSFTRGRPIKQGPCARRVNVSWLLAVGFMVCEPAELRLLPGGVQGPHYSQGLWPGRGIAVTRGHIPAGYPSFCTPRCCTPLGHGFGFYFLCKPKGFGAGGPCVFGTGALSRGRARGLLVWVLPPATVLPAQGMKRTSHKPPHPAKSL